MIMMMMMIILIFIMFFLLLLLKCSNFGCHSTCHCYYYYDSHCTGFVRSAQPGLRTDMWPRARRMALVSSLTSARRRNPGRLERGLELIELEVLMGKP